MSKRNENCLEIMKAIKKCGIGVGDPLSSLDLDRIIAVVVGGSPYLLKSYRNELFLKGFLDKRGGVFFVRKNVK